LFYSKSPEKSGKEKTVDKVKTGLEKFGDHKVMIFEGWLKDFKI